MNCPSGNVLYLSIWDKDRFKYSEPCANIWWAVSAGERQRRVGELCLCLRDHYFADILVVFRWNEGIVEKIAGDPRERGGGVDPRCKGETQEGKDEVKREGRKFVYLTKNRKILSNTVQRRGWLSVGHIRATENRSMVSKGRHYLILKGIIPKSRK